MMITCHCFQIFGLSKVGRIGLLDGECQPRVAPVCVTRFNLCESHWFLFGELGDSTYSQESPLRVNHRVR